MFKDERKRTSISNIIRKYYRLKSIGLLVLMALFILRVSLPTFAQETLSSATMISRSWLPTLTMEDAFTQVMIVLEFAPGAGTPEHSHGGPTLATVLEGELTLIEDGEEIIIAAGESWTELPGHVHQAINNSDAPVRVVFTVLLAEGTQVTIPVTETSLAAPTVISRAEFADITLEGVFDEVMIVLEFPPGAGVPEHMHSGPTLVTVMEGELTLMEAGEERVVRAGESWTELPGHIHSVVNAGDTSVRVTFTVLLPVPAPTILVGE
jgi:quercetin dioxygenase-like cupin family protein